MRFLRLLRSCWNAWCRTAPPRTVWTRAVVVLLAGLIALGALAPPATGQYFGRNKVTYEDFDFQTLDTEHFSFYLYPAEEQAVRDAARMAERWYERHTQVFLHRFEERKPFIFYANDADFKQTNVIDQAISPGTGGFTEPLRERVVMPLSASYGETNHVVGHELVHSFQYDLALNQDSLGISLRRLPTWLVEGMAEYLSVGRQDPHTAMWMRDAALRDDLPSIEDLGNPQEYFPYRYGQAYSAYIGGKYGDQAVTNLFKLGGRVGIDSALVRLTGITADSLSTEWKQAIRDAYLPLAEDRTPVDSAGTKLLAPDLNGGRVNIAPTLSPDGQYVAYISERSVFTFNLFVADAETGEVIARLQNAGTTPHFNALRFINSAGTWSPDGRRLAFVSYADGDNRLTIWNVETREIERTVAVEGVTAMKNPAWGPDGERIAFSGMDGGISDLYVYNRRTEAVRQLTNDRYADLQPTWSPSGNRLAFTTDRGVTDLETLDVSTQMRIGVIDLSEEGKSGVAGDIRTIAPFGKVLHHNPQFAPDGRSLYFVSTQDGFKDVYRMRLDTEELFRVTRLQTGVSGITALSPAMSVARQSGRMVFSVFSDGTYTGFTRPADAVQGTPMDTPTAGRSDAGPAGRRDTTEAAEEGAPAADDPLMAGGAPQAGVLPPAGAADEGLVAAGLADPRSGLPDADRYEVADYEPTLSLEAIAPPSGGVSTGGALGTRLSGGVGVRFGDLLGNQQLSAAVQVQGRIQDIGGQVSYLNRGNQFNYGASAGHLPVVYDVNLVPTEITSDGDPVTVLNRVVRRAYIDRISLDGTYPLDRNRRFEVGLGGTRYGFGFSVDTFLPGTPIQIDDLSLSEINDALGAPVLQEPKARYFGQASLAYVEDFSFQGLTSPIKGGRYRLAVTPRVGSTSLVTALADLRRYLYANPVTFALQGLHIGNYGARQGDFFADEYIGFPYGRGFVRGYRISSIDASRECPAGARTPGASCPALERLVGTRIAKVSAEVRVPLLGPERLSLIPFSYLPTELVAFAEGGLAWSRQTNFTLDYDPSALFRIGDRTPVYSAGVAARVNVLGALVGEVYYAYPFQRPEAGWQLGLRLTPGW